MGIGDEWFGIANGPVRIYHAEIISSNVYKCPIIISGLYINSAHMVLRGHRSIVNQVRFNQANHNIISSGVEKIVKVSITEVWKFFNEKIYFSPSLMEIMFYFFIFFFTKHAHRMKPS